MANEISANASVQVNKGGVNETLSAQSQETMAGANVAKKTQTIATSSTALSIASITGVPPVLLVKNLDATNYVEIDSASTFDKFPQKLLAGTFVLLRPQTATIYLRANTLAVQVYFEAMEP